MRPREWLSLDVMQMRILWPVKAKGQAIENLHGLFFVHFDGFNFYRYNTVVVFIPYVLLVVVRLS